MSRYCKWNPNSKCNLIKYIKQILSFCWFRYDTLLALFRITTLKWKERNVSERLKNPPPSVTQRSPKQQGFLCYPSLPLPQPCDTFLHLEFLSDLIWSETNLKQCCTSLFKTWQSITQSPTDVSICQYHQTI